MSVIGGLYTGLKYYAGRINTPSQIAQLDEYLNQIIDQNKEESVVSIFMLPTQFYSSGLTPVFERIRIERPDNNMGYYPKNKKLLQEPYLFLACDTGTDCANYRFESGIDGHIDFIVACGMSTNPEFVIYPYDYNGVPGHNSSESVTLTGFPQCAFTIDSFRAYCANGALGDMLGLGAGATSVAGGAIALAAGSGGTAIPAMAVVGGVLGLGQAVTGIINNVTKGSRTRGTQGGSTDVAIGEKKIMFKFMTVCYDSAKAIDAFFDRYGYACQLIKVPNRNVRPHWTYTKTKEVSVKGDVPAEHMSKIESIYNNGITFWNNINNVGNFGLDNSIS